MLSLHFVQNCDGLDSDQSFDVTVCLRQCHSLDLMKSLVLFIIFSFDVQFLGHHKMKSSKVTCIEVNIIKFRQNGVKFCPFFAHFKKLHILHVFVHFSCFCVLRRVIQKLKLSKRFFVQNFPAKRTS